MKGVKEFYRGTSLIREPSPLGPYSRILPRALWFEDFCLNNGSSQDQNLALNVLFMVQGLGFGVWGLRFKVWGLGFGVWSSGLTRVEG